MKKKVISAIQDVLLSLMAFAAFVLFIGVLSRFYFGQVDAVCNICTASLATMALCLVGVLVTNYIDNKNN